MYTNRRTIELLKQPKNIKDLLHRAIHIFQGDIFFEKTYPDVAEQAEFVLNALKDAAKFLNLIDITQRLECDLEYGHILGKVVSPRHLLH